MLITGLKLAGKCWAQIDGEKGKKIRMISSGTESEISESEKKMMCNTMSKRCGSIEPETPEDLDANMIGWRERVFGQLSGK